MDIKLLNDHICRIKYDEHTESPDDWGDESVFLVSESRYLTINRDNFDIEMLNQYESDVRNAINKIKPEYHMIRVSIGRHSQTNLTVNVNNNGLSECYVLVAVSEEPDLTKAIDLAVGLVSTWNSYLSGEIYYFKLIKLKTYQKVFDNQPMTNERFVEEEFVESCGGFYNTYDIIEHIPHDLLNKEIKEQFKHVNIC